MDLTPPPKRYRCGSSTNSTIYNLPRSISFPLAQILALGDFEAANEDNGDHGRRRANLLIHANGQPPRGWMMYDMEQPPWIIPVVFDREYLSKESIASIYLGKLMADVQLEKVHSSMYVVSFQLYTATPWTALDKINLLQQSSYGNPKAREPLSFTERLQNLPIELMDHWNDGRSYGFITSIIWRFGNHASADGSFSRLKLAILMSLVCGADKPTDDLPDAKVYSSLLVLNDEDLIVGQLLIWASQTFVRNAFFHSSITHTLTGTTEAIRITNSNESMQGNSAPSSVIDFVHAGTLAMAADGIHLMTGSLTLDMLPKKELDSLAHTLQSGQIHSKERIGTGENEVDRRLRSTVWSQGSLADFRPSSGLGRAGGSINGNASPASKMAHLFGMIVAVPRCPLTYCHPARGPSLLTGNEWRKYIDLAMTIEPKYSEEAEAMLSQFFAEDTNIPENSSSTRLVNIMLNMSKALARLNLRWVVTEEDVLLALLLYHERLQTLYDYLPDRFFLVDMTHAKTRAEATDSLDEFIDYQENYMLRFRHFLSSQWQSQSPPTQP